MLVGRNSRRPTIKVLAPNHVNRIVVGSGTVVPLLVFEMELAPLAAA